MAANPNKPTKKIDIYEADMPILEAMLSYIESEQTEEGLRFAFKLMGEMADKIKAKDAYVNDKCERWRQAQLRSKLPFYG